MAVLRKGDVGTKYTMTIKDETSQAVPIGAATTKTIRFKKPDKTSVDKPAVFTTDGSDGKISYVFVANDLDQAGEWIAQAYVVLGTGMEWRSTFDQFTVHSNL